MSRLDVVNGFFELLGAALSWLNVKKLYKDNTVAGVYWPVTAFFGVWGAWNLIYYWQLGQYCSWAAGVLLCSANCVWAAKASSLKKELNE